MTLPLERAGAPDAYGPPAARRFDPHGPLPHGTVLLEASAGTGKTYGIASLVLRLVAEGAATVDQVLVVTFTEAAAKELRDRVRQRLRDAHRLCEAARLAGALPEAGRPRDEVARRLVARALADGSAAVLEARLRDALQRFDDAPITTIHGFCRRVLAEHPVACGAELDAELVPDQTPLLDALARDAWPAETARRSVDEVWALVQHGRLSLDVVRALVQRVAAHPDAPCVPACDEPGEPLRDATARREAALGAIADAWAGEESHAAGELLGDWCDRKLLNGRSYTRDKLEAAAAQVADWAVARERTPPAKALALFSASTLRASLNKAANGVPPAHSLFDRVQAALEADAAVAAAAALEARRVLHDVARWARAELAERRRRARQHGFDDLLRLVRDALVRDGVPRDDAPARALRAALRERFRAVLIDEFQDTDAMQWALFAAAFGGDDHRLVLIGDPKQSIYAFRGADLDVYLDARARAGAPLLLDRNWRTEPALLQALDALWGAHPAPFVTPDIQWRAVRGRDDGPRLEGGGAPLQLRHLVRKGALENAKAITKEAVGGVLPTLVASDVARFLASGARLVDESGARAVRPADVAVLVRTNEQARTMQAALRQAGIPAVVQGAASVFASIEARELSAVLAAVLEPASHARARAALATDLLGVAAAAECGGAGAGDALARLDADEARWDLWADRFRAWRAAWRDERAGRGGPMRLVRALLDDLQLPAHLLALTDGERRLTNLLHLAELLHFAAVDGALAPNATLAWLRDRIATADDTRDDEALQLRLESDDAAAQVVTMHRSKGLEYGAVWCPYLWDGGVARAADATHPCVPTGARPGARAIDVDAYRDGAARGASAVERDSVARLRDAAHAESLRLAYVAMTRAKHRLTLWWGAVTDCALSPLGWLLHGDAGVARRDMPARLGAAEDAVLRARLEALAGPLVTVVEEDADAPLVRWSAPPAPQGELAARRWQRTTPLDDGWRLGSFTGLTRDAHAPDADGELEPLGDARGIAVDDEEPDVPLAAFPASAQAGIFFHEVLERHDVTEAHRLRELVADRLAAYGFDAEAWTAPVTDALGTLLDAPLGPGLRLRDVPRADRLTELRFELPACDADGAPSITPAALAQVFRDHPGGAVPADYADALADLDFRPLRGFLTGAIDLVARTRDGAHDHARPRWWLLDYKSNRLGPRRVDYAPERLVREMTDAHYVLQYHLYTLALHRWLRLRLGDAYDYERDVAGACYVFLRGVGDGTGVFVDRPPRARLEALDRLFREGHA